MGSCRCKMCGGHIHYDDNVSVATCEYCGTEQTVFRSDNAKQLNLFNRANALRMQNEFDKAQLTYDNILIDDPTNAEAHWGICLCRYGIEYIEEGKNKKRIPTCHRTIIKSIFEDLDYKDTINNADVVAKRIYESEAKAIDKLQKDILSISQKEEPYDIFISYKEHDEFNNRTEDSIKAENLYNELTKKGYRVFYSKKALANKEVSDYEPIIFAALQSSKVMLSIGSKKEYFNSIWEKNEWSRFISFIQDKQNKYLIPCYFDMELEDLPIEFMPFEEELLDDNNISRIVNRVIKLLNRNNLGSNNQINKSLVSNLIERAKYCLENSEFDKVLEIVENILNVDYKCAIAYFYNVLAKNNCRNEYDLSYKKIILRNQTDYKEALKFADEEYKKYLLELEQRVLKLTSEISNEKIYKRGKEYIDSLRYDLAIGELRKINGYKDVDTLLEECYERSYEYAVAYMERHNYNKAIQLFKILRDYKDSKYKLAECEQSQKDEAIKSECDRICNGLDAIISDVKSKGYFPGNSKSSYWKGLSLLKDLKTKSEYASRKYDEYLSIAEELRLIEEEYYRKIEEEKKREERRERIKKLLPPFIALAIVFVIVLAIIIGSNIASKNRKNKRYNQAVENIENNKYSDAYNLLKDLNYKNSEDLLKLLDARSYLDKDDYEKAIDIVYNLGGTTTVSYDSETGSVDKNSDIIKKQHINNYASSMGKEFIGWDIDSYSIDYKKYNLTLSLVAKFESIEYNIVYYDISAATEDYVSLPLTYTYDENGSLKIPNAVKKGYTFLGWSFNSETDYKKDYELSTNRIGDISLKAHWEANKYTITLDVNGGPELAETKFEVTQGESFTLPIPGEKEGYTFVGYGTFTIDKNGKTHNFLKTNAQGVSLNPYTYGEDVTLYALWEGKEYKVTIKAVGGGYITIPNSTPSVIDDEKISVGETKVKTIQCGDRITLKMHLLHSTCEWYVDGVYAGRETTFTFTVQPHDSVIELR